MSPDPPVVFTPNASILEKQSDGADQKRATRTRTSRRGTTESATDTSLVWVSSELPPPIVKVVQDFSCSLDHELRRCI